MNGREDAEYKFNMAYAIWGIFSLIDSFATSALYVCYIKPSFILIYNNTLRFFLLPAYAVDASVGALGAWYIAHLDRNDNGTLKTGRGVYAAVNTITAFAMIGASVFSFIIPALAPAFFALNMGVNAFYNLGAAIFYWGKTVATPTCDNASSNEDKLPNKRTLYRDRAIGHAIAGVLGLVMVVVAVAVIPLEKIILAPVGMTLGIIGIVLNTISIIQSFRKIHEIRKAHKEKEKSRPIIEVMDFKSLPGNTKCIYYGLNAKPEREVQPLPSDSETLRESDDHPAPIREDVSHTQTYSARKIF